MNAPSYRSNDKLILLVTSDVLNSGFFIDNTRIKFCHVNSTSKIFPSISTLHPGTIIIDHDFLNDEVQNLVRRIRTNPFYAKLKICCLKASFNRKIDEQLKVTGVDYLVYKNNNPLSV
jgi:hypothetical protein